MIIYAFLLVIDNDNSKLIEYFENISVGVIGSMFVSLLISIITYLLEKNKALESYYNAYINLFNHCGKYDCDLSTKQKVEWFEQYHNLFHTLDDSWGDIDYIYDKYNNRTYLTAVRNYYYDFISLTQDYFMKLNDDDNYNKHILDYIEKVLYDVDIREHGIFRKVIHNNKLTYDMALVVKEIHDIYLNNHDSNKLFLKTLVTDDVFIILNDEEEEALVLLKNKMDKTNSANNVRADISDEICDSLLKKGYISSYSSERENRTITCNYIVSYYFELKSRLQK